MLHVFTLQAIFIRLPYCQIYVHRVCVCVRERERERQRDRESKRDRKRESERKRKRAREKEREISKFLHVHNICLFVHPSLLNMYEKGLLSKYF